MSKKIAVAIVHGVGTQGSHFAGPMIEELTDRFADHTGLDNAAARAELIMEPVYWAPVLQGEEDRLWRRVSVRRDLDWVKARRFMIDFAGDAIAYQPTPWGREVYESIHAVFANSLKKLAQQAGGTAPLCVIAHSLGTVITSNYFYDLSQRRRRGMIPARVREAMGRTALERGDTFALLYTLGSPIAVWSLRYEDFGCPITVPSPKLADHYADLRGEWVNYYDPDDVIAYPLKPLNDAYRGAVRRDVAVNVGGLIAGATPLSHTSYWTDNDVTKPIAKALANAWKRINA